MINAFDPAQKCATGRRDDEKMKRASWYELTAYRCASDVGHSKTLTAEDAEDAEEEQNEEKQNWNYKSGVIDREPLSAQFNAGNHSPLNAFNSCPFPLVHFLRVLCVLCDRRLN